MQDAGPSLMSTLALTTWRPCTHRRTAWPMSLHCTPPFRASPCSCSSCASSKCCQPRSASPSSPLQLSRYNHVSFDLIASLTIWSFPALDAYRHSVCFFLLSDASHVLTVVFLHAAVNSRRCSHFCFELFCCMWPDVCPASVDLIWHAVFITDSWQHKLYMRQDGGCQNWVLKMNICWYGHYPEYAVP